MCESNAPTWCGVTNRWRRTFQVRSTGIVRGDSGTLARTIMLFCAMLAFSPAVQANLIGVDYATGDLYRISSTNASISVIGNTGVAKLGGLELGADGFLYGITTTEDAALYKIDPSNADATLIGPLDIGFVFEGSLAFAPDGTAYTTNQGTSASPDLYTVALDTGTATIAGLVAPGDHDINGLAWRSDGEMIALDRETNALILIDPATGNIDGTLVVLSPTVGGVGGMTAIGNVGYFTTAGPNASPPGSNALYSVDLFTGAYQLVGSFSGTIHSVGISGLALPEPTTGLLLAMTPLFLVRRRNR